MRLIAAQFQPTPVDEPLQDATRLDLAGGVRVIFTPGHMCLYLVLSPIPLAYSIIEWQQVPLRLRAGRWQVAPLGQWVVWLIVYAMDAITTWNGLGVVDRSAPLIVQQLSAALAGRVVMTAVLTIGPEALLRSMVSIFRKALGRGEGA